MKEWRSTSLRLNNHDFAQLHWLAERYNRPAQRVLRELVRSCVDTESPDKLLGALMALALQSHQIPLPCARRIVKHTEWLPMMGAILISGVISID